MHSNEYLAVIYRPLCTTKTLIWKGLLAGAAEFRDYLPPNTSSVSLQPLGTEGILVAGSDRQRGFGPVDQVLHLALCRVGCALLSQIAQPLATRANMHVHIIRQLSSARLGGSLCSPAMHLGS